MKILIPILMIFIFLFSPFVSSLLIDAEEPASKSSAFALSENGESSHATPLKINYDNNILFSESRTLSRRGTSWEEMEYVHYDPTYFYNTVSRLLSAADEGDSTSVIEIYDEAYDELLFIDTLTVITYINSCTDVTDTGWIQENLYCNTLWSETSNALCTACQQILEGECGEEFANYVGEKSADYFSNYQSLSSRGAEIREEEAVMVTQYYEIMNSLSGLNSSEKQQALQEQVGPLFLELVSLRAEYAELMGYSSYSDYAYEVTYDRDYTTEEAQELCDAVKIVAREYYVRYSDADPWYDYDSVYPCLDGEELINTLGTYLSQIDESLVDAWVFMTENGLYDLGESADRITGSYTITLTYYDSPFLFQTLKGNCYDIFTLSHEFGHFAEAYRNSVPNLLSSMGNLDLFEIHSNGLTLLYSQFYNDIYTSGADTVLFITLGNQMDNLISGCIFDEFQRSVYENPDMTLEEINQLFAEICTEYGMYSPKDSDSSWMYIPHNFESPLYYISYAVSSLAALQIWDMAQTDYDAAINTYLSLIEKGAYDESYFQVLSSCGLRLFTEDGAVAAICSPVLEKLDSLLETS